MGCSSRYASVRSILVLLGVLAVALAGLVYAQGIQTSPYSTSSMVRGLSSEGLAPPSPFAPPGAPVGSSGTIPITSGLLKGILPPIPNLQFGYFVNLGKNVRSDRTTIDYIRPVHLSERSVIFGEGHTEFSDFLKTLKGSPNSRVDMSFGGGYRHVLRKTTLVGINGFYDTARLGGTWYSSGSLGLQMAAELPGNDALDLNFNWYGKLFQSSVITNAFRNGPSNYDFQAGYSHELWNGGPDFRLSATGYKFDAGQGVYGANAAAEVKSRDGVFVLRYAVGNDKINQTYHTIGATVNAGFTPENLLRGESPFSMPQPIFRSPRNLLNWLDSTMSTIRNFSQPASALIFAQLFPSNPEQSPTPPTPRIIFTGVAFDSGPSGTETLANVDLSAATFDVEGAMGTDIIPLTYGFMMSDGSVQTVTGAVAITQDPPPGIIDPSGFYWLSDGMLTVGPSAMPAAATDTQATFRGAHEVILNGALVSGAAAKFTCTIQVPSRPDIAKLVITGTVHVP